MDLLEECWRPTSGFKLSRVDVVTGVSELNYCWPFLWTSLITIASVEVSEMASAKMASAIVSVSTMWGRYWNSVLASLWREFCSVLQVRVDSGVDTEFLYRVHIVDRGVDCRAPVCQHRFRFPASVLAIPRQHPGINPCGERLVEEDIQVDGI